MQGILGKNPTTSKWYIEDCDSKERIPLSYSDYLDIIADKDDESIPDGDFEGDTVEYEINPDDHSAYITSFVTTKGDSLDINELL